MITPETSPQAPLHSPSGPENRPLVSVVLLSYARPQFLAEALESVVRQSYPNLEILVVDNPSGASAEIAAIVRRHPEVKLIQNAENLGFAAGMNVGMQNASGDYIYLTEDDIVLEPNCICELVQHALAEPSPGLMSGLMYNKQERTIRSAGGRLTLGTVFKMEMLSQGEMDQGQFPAPFDVTYIPGAMVFASRELWKSLKPAFCSGLYWRYLGIAFFAAASTVAGVCLWAFLPHAAIGANFAVLELVTLAQIAAPLWMKAASARWVALHVALGVKI